MAPGIALGLFVPLTGSESTWEVLVTARLIVARVTLLILFADTGSLVAVVPVAVLVRPPLGFTVVLITSVADVPLESVPTVQVGAVKVPTLGTAPTNVYPVGNVSDTLTEAASDGPRLVAVIVKANGPPIGAAELDAVLTMRRSAERVTLLVSLALLLVGSVSITPAELGLIDAVLVIEDNAELEASCPDTVKVAIPNGKSDTVCEIGPVPVVLLHDDPAPGAQVHVGNVMSAGGLSVTGIPATE